MTTTAACGRAKAKEKKLKKAFERVDEDEEAACRGRSFPRLPETRCGSDVEGSSEKVMDKFENVIKWTTGSS